VTKEDRVLPDVQDLAGRWDHQDLLDYLDHRDRLEDRDLVVHLVPKARLEYLVDMPVSTSPSILFVVVYFSDNFSKFVNSLKCCEVVFARFSNCI